MSEEDRAKTAIVTAFGKYEFPRMPFGLVNATSTSRDLWIGSWRVCMTFVLPMSMIYSSSVRILRSIYLTDAEAERDRLNSQTE